MKTNTSDWPGRHDHFDAQTDDDYSLDSFFLIVSGGFGVGGLFWGTFAILLAAASIAPKRAAFIS